jgi:alpha-galactosidase
MPTQPVGPRFHGPTIVGVRPGTPLLHALAATGRPLSYSASGLPDGVVLDPDRGLLTGRIDRPGEYRVDVAVENEHGRDARTLRVVVGDRLALTPPVGWMSWNMFGRRVDQTIIRETIDSLVSTGMRDVGYEYVCIDDFWHTDRNPDGTMQPDPERFPGGIAPLAEYAHDLGLKLGIYSDAGTLTCGGRPGSFGFETQDAETFASWGVDYLKYDYCHAPPDRDTAFERYSTMGNALRKTGRSIVFAICEWGGRAPWEWGADAGGHLWRTTGDIQDVWAAPEGGWFGIVDAIDRQASLDAYTGRGWHDPDMLVVGLRGRGSESSHVSSEGCTDAEYRSQMSLWAMLAAPLIASCDVRSMDDATRETLTNPEIIAIAQDELGRPARRLAGANQSPARVEIWERELAGGRRAFAFLNRDNGIAQTTVKADSLRLAQAQRLRDVWAHAGVSITGEAIHVTLEPHATTVLILL